MQTTLRDTVTRGMARAVLGLGLAASAVWALAQQSPLVGYEDIDLFVNPPPASDRPNVLLVLDTSANWSAAVGTKACTTYADGTAGPAESSSKAGIEKCGLVNALYSLPVNPDGSGKFNVGLLYLNAANADGAYPRVRFLELNAANKKILMDEVKGTTTNANIGDQASNADLSRALWEAYLWYKGMAPYRGQAQTNPSRIRWDKLAFDASGKYVSPATSSCGRNYVIMMANGVGNTAEDDIRAKFVAEGGNGTKIPYPTKYMSNSAQSNWADETARFIRGVDVSTQDGVQSIVTYSLAVTDPAKDKDADWVNNYNYIKEIAIQGGGSFYAASDSASVTVALRNIFDQIQAANSVFASASLPVSVNAQGTFLNQVFMGMFRPDEQSRPRWVGNLKQYQFGYNSATQRVTLVDAADNPAVNPGTGFIQPGARSFWTSASPITDFWKNKQWSGEVNAGGASDSPDGQLVEKGGAAQRMREAYLTDALQANRKVVTYTGSGGLVDFDTALNKDLLGLTTNTERNDLVAWVRGKDNRSPSDEQGPGTVTKDGVDTATTVRATIHGDVIHSSPAVVNYGGSTGVVVFYGSNGGMLHAVRGNKTGTGAGQELWSFIPQEFLTKLKRLRDNSPRIQFATTDMTEYPDARRKDYAMDGPITFYQKLGSGGKVYLYAAMRRGGQSLYAFDVTDPSSPSLLWKVGPAQIAGLGQTWSEARVTRIAGITDPVIIMGGGYDPAEDSSALGSTTMGNIVAVLNARTGDVLKVFGGISRPVPAAVATVDANNDGLMDRAYAVDLGGSIYRLVFPSAKPEDWTLTKIADFSESTGSGQKMFYAPAVTPVKIGGQTAFAIQVGTGDREKPLKASGTDNRFFTVLDKGQTSAVKIGALEEMGMNGLSKIADDKYGCYFNLPNAGEKVVNAVTYTSGYSFFGTNAPTPPSSTSCTGSLGVARSYAIPAMCGPVKVTTLEGGGFPPTAVTGRVLIPPPAKEGELQVDCETHPAKCFRVPVGIGINPPDCAGNLPGMSSAIGATNIYACAPPQRLRRDWSIRNPR